jgi:hypothetical protein
MTDYEKYSLVVRVLGTVATFLAVIVAIWGERIRLWWTQPKLKISLCYSVGSLTTRGDGKKARYYSLDVINEKRSYPAKNVRVLLTRIEKKGPDGNWKPIKFSAPVHVTWKWPNITPPYTTIGPDEMSTFGFLVEGSPTFDLQLYWCPNNLVPHFPPNDPLRLIFKAVSDTVESDTLTVQVAWDGKWEEGSNEMQQHLIVKAI